MMCSHSAGMPVQVGQMDQGSQDWHHHLQNKPSCCRAWQGGFGGQQRKGAIGKSSGAAVNQLGKDGRWKELWLLSLASSRAPCPDFCLISSILHFKAFLLQFCAFWRHRKAKEYPQAYKFPPDPSNLVCHL